MCSLVKAELSHPDSRSDLIGGSEPSSGFETIYWDSLPDFFFKAELVPVGYGPTSYNRIKISYTYQKNYHRSGVHQNLYTFTESHLQIQTVLLHLQIRARNLHVVNPYKSVGPAICGCFQMSYPVPTRTKNPC